MNHRPPLVHGFRMNMPARFDDSFGMEMPARLDGRRGTGQALLLSCLGSRSYGVAQQPDHRQLHGRHDQVGLGAQIAHVPNT